MSQDRSSGSNGGKDGFVDGARGSPETSKVRSDIGLDRRSYLKLVGAGAAGTGFAAASSSPADAASYDTITLAPGEMRAVSVGSGETYENKLIDMTADGADFRIVARGDGWAIRNVGFKGAVDVGAETGGYGNKISAEGNGVIEHVYLGDGCEWGTRNGAEGTGPDHAGHIDVIDCYIEGWSGNAVYAAGPGRVNPPGKTDGQGGTLAFQNCYFANNNIAHLRVASDGTTVDDCVFVNSNEVPPHPNTSGGDSGVVNSRGIYTGYGDPSQHVHVRNSDFHLTYGNTCSGSNPYTGCGTSVAVSGDHSTYGHLTEVHLHDTCEIVGQTSGEHVIVDSGVGNSPDTSVPDGVPTTPEEAASATSGGGSAVQVQEDFGHADVPGTYSLDTGAFTTSATRLTTGSYSLLVDDGSNVGEIILREDMETTAGETYELDFYLPAGPENDAGFLFGAQGGVTSWNDYTGYFGFFDSGVGEIRLDYWENGSQVSSRATAVTWPLDEWLTVELDYRDSNAGTITMTVSDATDSQLGSVSLADATRDSGAVGWYNYGDTANWHADSWFNVQDSNLLEDFGHADVPGTYSLDTGAFTTTSTRSTTGSYSLQVSDDANGGRLVLRDDLTVQAGTTYEYDVYLPTGPENDAGFLFGAQGGVTSWNDYTGYMAFFDSGVGDIRVDYWENGTWTDYATTAVAWPLDEWLTVELDYRDSDASTITMTVVDSNGSQLGNASLAHTTHDGGAVGWYNYADAANWHADSVRER